MNNCHTPDEPSRAFRSLFLSDLHLGARGSRPREVLSFLRAHDARTIYLVGDILDLWHGGRVCWSAAHDAVISELVRKAATGTRIVYLAGNHDATLRESEAACLPQGWELREAVRHEAADGRNYLVLHGDQVDSRFLRWHWMTRLGSRVDSLVRGIDAWLGQWSGATARDQRGSLIQRAIRAFNALFVMGGTFERRLTSLARAADMDGVICGHSHKPSIHTVENIRFANCGDWVDSMTALGEESDGTLGLIEWARGAEEVSWRQPKWETGLARRENA